MGLVTALAVLVAAQLVLQFVDIPDLAASAISITVALAVLWWTRNWGIVK